MPSLRSASRVLLALALHGLAREVDAAIGLALHATVASPGMAWAPFSLLEPGAGLRLLMWLGLGALAWVVLGLQRARSTPSSLGPALAAEASTFDPLYLRPVVTLLALASLWVHPTYPYGFTLPVALTQDWGVAQDAVAVAWLLALRLPALRLPAPRAREVFFLSFLVYALLSPEWARHWQGHPGNEPKTLRMAVAVGHDLTLDAEGVSAAMEELDPSPLAEAVRRSGGRLLGESWRMLRALAHGPSAVGKDAIRARRITRQTVRGKDGGVFYVLAPGPSILLAPALRVDRALNRILGTTGRLAVTLLLWNALAAALVAALFRFTRKLTGGPGLAALACGLVALSPPFLFYFYQFYPEMLGALVLTLVFHRLAFSGWSTGSLLVQGLLIASLPWLHQKFLPVWAVLTLQAGVMAVERLVTLRALLALLVPQVVTVYLTALYNFAITGSVRPDALFLAWGPGGVTGARVGEGLLGLLLDARYGLLPYAPVYLLAAAGLALGLRRGSPLRLAVPAVLTYYVTVAAADNWSGAVCALGRYLMPAVPFLVALAVVALHRTRSRRGVAAVALTLSAFSALIAISLFQDPHAANDCARLLARSSIADGHVYIPDLFYRSPRYAAPGQAARVLAIGFLVLATGLLLWRAAVGKAGRSVPRSAIGLLVVPLLLAWPLEHWPSPRRGPHLEPGLAIDPATTLWVRRGARVEDGTLRATRGRLELLVRSREPLLALRLDVWGDGWLGLPGGRRLAVKPRGTRMDLPLDRRVKLSDPGGGEEGFYWLHLRVETPGYVWLRGVAGVHEGNIHP